MLLIPSSPILFPLFLPQLKCPSFLLSLNFLFTIMINFCMKSVHSLLGFANSKDSGTVENPAHCRILPSSAGGLSFITFSGDIHLHTNVVESSAVKSPPSSPTADAAGTAVKKDPGGIGFIDEVGGSVDGLMSCTESLGFESSDERRVDDQIENINNEEFSSRTSFTVRSKWKRKAAKSEVKKFPPPLSSLNQNGKPTFFLRSVRKDGRLELREVKIDRLEVLRASRQDGRLRLQLISDVDVDQQTAEEEEEEKIQETIEEEEEEKIKESIEEEEEEEEEDEKNMEKTIKEEEEIGGKWLFPVTNGGGDGFRRCHELVSHHHHHNLHAWSQHCVTIR